MQGVGYFCIFTYVSAQPDSTMEVFLKHLLAVLAHSRSRFSYILDHYRHVRSRSRRASAHRGKAPSCIIHRDAKMIEVLLENASHHPPYSSTLQVVL